MQNDSEEKERRDEEREQADLEAQRGMAKSARELLSTAWWQVWIASAGAVLLGFSLSLVPSPERMPRPPAQRKRS